MDCTVILPAYRPPEQMAEFIRALVGAGFSDILLVDDGSGPAYAALFDRAEKDGAALLRHEKNRGKGAALKTAFRACMEREQPPKAVITAKTIMPKISMFFLIAVIAPEEAKAIIPIISKINP